MITDDADGAAIEARKAHNEIFGVVFVDFEEKSIVDNRMDGVFDVVGLLRVNRNESVEHFIAAAGRIRSRAARRIRQIVRRKKTHQLAYHGQAIGVVTRNEVGHAAGGVMGHRAAELLLGDFLVRDVLDDVRAGDEHVGSFAGHENEIGDGR